MAIDRVPADVRTGDYFHHIDMGFLNQRLCLTVMPADARAYFGRTKVPGSDHLANHANYHLLVTILLDVCESNGLPTLLEALRNGNDGQLFRSTERLVPCPQVYDDMRVSQSIYLDVPTEQPVVIEYHTEHLMSSTGTMTLASGFDEGYIHSIVGVLHNRKDTWEIQPIVIGTPWLDHPRNGDSNTLQRLMWHGRDYGEILPEDIEQFAQMATVKVEGADEWMNVMSRLSEDKIKEVFASLLNEPTKSDWGGEQNDHYSNNVVVAGQRKTAAFLFKGPSRFSEMTIAMCGKNADQIYRLVNSGADISVVQHAHLIGPAVRETLRSMTVTPGRPRKYCVIDGQATYRLLMAYGVI